MFVRFVPLAGSYEVFASLNWSGTATYRLRQQRFCSLRSCAPVLFFSLLFSCADVHAGTPSSPILCCSWDKYKGENELAFIDVQPNPNSEIHI